MILTSDLNPTGDYTRVLNDVIFDERLSHAEFRFWCQLLALPRGAKDMVIDANMIAKELNLSEGFCRTQRRSLKEKGFLIVERNRIVVTIPDSSFKPKEAKLTKEQQQRNDLRDAWNEHKPDAYSKQRHPLSAAQVETLQLHAEHNGEKDLCKFLTTALKGCKAEDWWKDKNLNFNNVFGTGTPKQNKFTNVEKLFKLASSEKGQAALFDVSNDQCWIDWYQSNSHEMAKVVRLEMPQSDAWIHQVDNDGDGTIYVYTDEGQLVHWTYKEGQHGVSYLPTAR